MRQVILSIYIIFLTGCAGTIDAYVNRQVIEDQMITDGDETHEIGTIAVTAQRRLIVGNLKTGAFCSEPPPETADSISTVLAAALSADIAPEENVNATLASNFARHVNQLYKRSHTVQIFRDAAFYLCVDAVNSTSDNNEYPSYRHSLVKILDMLKPSLDKELELYYETEKARAENPPGISQDMIVCNPSASVDTASGNVTSILCPSSSRTVEPNTDATEPNDT